MNLVFLFCKLSCFCSPAFIVSINLVLLFCMFYCFCSPAVIVVVFMILSCCSVCFIASTIMLKKYNNKECLQFIYSSMNTLSLCKIQLVFCATSLGIKYGFCEPRYESIKGLKVSVVMIFHTLRTYFLETGYAPLLKLLHLTLWQFARIDIRTITWPTRRELDKSLSPWSEQKKVFVSDNDAFKTITSQNAIYLPFATWGSNFVLLAISKQMHLKQCDCAISSEIRWSFQTSPISLRFNHSLGSNAP